MGAVRLFYRLVPRPAPRDLPKHTEVHIEITYASGKVNCYRPRFDTEAEAEEYIRRFLPDLVGKRSTGGGQ